VATIDHLLDISDDDAASEELGEGSRGPVALLPRRSPEFGTSVPHRPGTCVSLSHPAPGAVATGLPQNDALACQKDMGHDRTGVVWTVDREAGLRSRLADAYVRSAPG
jgi:hypothetical protein